MVPVPRLFLCRPVVRGGLHVRLRPTMVGVDVEVLDSVTAAEADRLVEATEAVLIWQAIHEDLRAALRECERLNADPTRLIRQYLERRVKKQ